MRHFAALELTVEVTDKFRCELEHPDLARAWPEFVREAGSTTFDTDNADRMAVMRRADALAGGFRRPERAAVVHSVAAFPRAEGA